MPVLFTEVPDFYLLEQIYDPDTNTTGQIVPKVGSLILDPINDNRLMVVESVDPNTLKVTYGIAKTSLLVPDLGDPGLTSSDISIIDYGNSRFYLFYDERESPTKLTVDKKLVIIGDDAESYSIMKKVSDTEYVPISLYFDENGVFQGNFIPLIELDNSNNLKYCPGCSTSMGISDDDVYYLHIFDQAGTLTGTVKLFCRKALITNIFDDTRIITDFTIHGTQELNGEFYLYPEQDVDSLMINARLTYNTGETYDLGIDGNLTYMYGLENFIPSYPGQEAEVLVKYYLQDFQQAVGSFVESSNGVRFLVATKKLKVLTPSDVDFQWKISVIPYYLSSQSRYTLLFMLYEYGNAPILVTDYVEVSNFNGLDFTTDQVLDLSINLRDVHPNLPAPKVVHQNTIVRLAPFTYYERYYIMEPGNDYAVYGVESPILSRPVLYFDDTLQEYFIPTSKFPNVNSLLEAFYYKAAPVFDTNISTSPPEPTHFVVRDPITGGLLTAAPIPLTTYQQSFAITDPNPDGLLNRTCIVEFHLDLGAGLTPLYGVPVDVYTGTFNQ